MIVRISRSRHPINREGELFRAIEPLVDALPRPRGLLDLIVARRPLEDGLVERLVISMWANLGDLEHGLHPPWDVADDNETTERPEASIEQFEIEADDWPEFVEMARVRARRLS